MKTSQYRLPPLLPGWSICVYYQKKNTAIKLARQYPKVENDHLFWKSVTSIFLN